MLAGGGVSGVAWEPGILTVLQRAGLDLKQADLVAGTSTESEVGAQLTSGADLEQIYTLQLAPAGQSREQTVDFDVDKFSK